MGNGEQQLQCALASDVLIEEECVYGRLAGIVSGAQVLTRFLGWAFHFESVAPVGMFCLCG